MTRQSIFYDEQISHAEVLMTKAKKMRAGAEKLRGFYKSGVPSGERKKGTKPFKSKSSCSKCGQRGHWHRDKDSNGKSICPPGGQTMAEGQSPEEAWEEKEDEEEP